MQLQNGERYIAWSTETRNVEDIAARIDQILPEIGLAPPTLTEVHPDRLRGREAEFRGVWSRADLRNDRMRAVTGVEFRPFDDSLRDCVESLISVAGVQPNRRENAVPVD